jgi:hypothetical protein
MGRAIGATNLIPIDIQFPSNRTQEWRMVGRIRKPLRPPRDLHGRPAMNSLANECGKQENDQKKTLIIRNNSQELNAES